MKIGLELGFKYVDKLYITEIYSEVDGNTYFPEWNKRDWKEILSHRRRKAI